MTASRDYALLVFDWDGTLADSEAIIVQAMQTAIKTTGMPGRKPAEIRELIGLGLMEAVEQLYPHCDRCDAEVLTMAYRDAWLAATTQPVPLFASASDTLKLLQSRGYLLAVATGKSRRGLHRALMETALDGMFIASRCAEETLSKPDPLMLNELLEELDLNPEAALMVGDTAYDMEMAAKAGVDAVGINTGVHDRMLLLQCQPLDCLDNLGQLPDWLTARCQRSENIKLTQPTGDRINHD